MTSYDILVIILSIFLAIFLALFITLLVIMIRIFRRIDSITQKAEHFTESLEEAGEFFKNAAKPVAVSKMVGNIVEWAKQSKNKEDKDE